MSEFTIHAFHNTHTSALHALLRAQLEEERALFYKPSLLTHDVTSDETITRLLDFWQENPAIAIFVATDNSSSAKAYAFIAAQIKNDIYNNEDVLSGEILAVYVAENSRNCGVGQALLNRAEEWFTQNGVYAVNVSWLHGNAASQALYQRLGFEPVYATGRKRLK